MRNVPAWGGGCHHPDYVAAPKFATILGSDAPGSYRITMSCPATLRTVEHTPLWTALAPMSTERAGPAGVAFFLQHGVYAQPLRLVGELVAHTAKRPLMQFLIRGGADIQFLPDIAHIPCFLERNWRPFIRWECSPS